MSILLKHLVHMGSSVSTGVNSMSRRWLDLLTSDNFGDCCDSNNDWNDFIDFGDCTDSNDSSESTDSSDSNNSWESTDSWGSDCTDESTNSGEFSEIVDFLEGLCLSLLNDLKCDGWFSDNISSLWSDLNSNIYIVDNNSHLHSIIII